MQVLQEMQNALLHHFMFAPKSKAMVGGKGVKEPVEQASEGFAELAVSLPKFFEFLHIDIVAG